MIVFTSICANYAHKARILAWSVHRHIPDALFVLCLTERNVPKAIADEKEFDRVVLSRTVWEGNFERFIFKHDIVEASTAVKGAFFHWFQQEYPDEKAFIYLDPDCCVYSDFPEVREALKEKPAVLCPHLLHPGNIDMELSSTAHGVYNLGFLAVNNSPEAWRLIDWWSERLYLFCYDDIPRGIFTDQKWMELIPCFFDVKILRHYGYDLAPWNLQNTLIQHVEGDDWLIQGQPLRFGHFSGFGQVAEQCMSKWLGKDSSDYLALYAEYAKRHSEMNADHVSETPWSYANYDSGEPVSRTVRTKYRENWDVMFAQEDPFAMSNRYFEEKLGIIHPEGDSRRHAGRLLTKKIRTARRVVKEQGMNGILKVMRDKARRNDA